MPGYLTVRFTAPLPFEIHGGLHHWRVFVAYGGKNDSKGMLIAYCDATKEQITILNGRARYIEGAIHRQISAQKGTTLWLIFRKLVRLGLAEIVER